MIQIYDKYGKIKQSGLPGYGTVTNVSAGDFSPLFTTAVTSPTSAPDIQFNTISQSANLFYASPNGSSGNPTFRSISSGDIPDISSLYVPIARTITINGITYDLSANRTWTISAGVWGSITGTLSSQTDLITYLSTNYYPSSNPNSYITASALSPYLTSASAASTYAALIGAVFTGPISATNLSNTNTGDETTSTIQTKRPLKTVASQSLEGSGNVALSKSDVGLGNVDDTSDANKPISTATQTALNKITSIENTTDGTVSSGVTITVSSVLPIPAGTYGAGMMPDAIAIGRKTGTNGTLSIRLYLNTTADLTGSPILVGQASSIASNLQGSIQRFLRIKVADGTGAGTEVTNVGTPSISDYGAVVGASQNIAPNWNNTLYLIATVQCGSGSDSARISSLKIRR